MATLLNKSSWVMIQRSLFKVKSTLKLFVDSDAEYVVDFFPDALSSKTAKLLVFQVFPDSAPAGPDSA